MEEQKEVAVLDNATLETPVCRHHWIIEAPSGPVSKGRCKLCGELKEFSNAAMDLVWDDTPLSDLFGPQWVDLKERELDYDS